jgi:uncharacterized protein
MRFWDSSAVIPLCLSEPTSGALTRLATTDPELVTWWGTRVECASALSRRRREGLLATAAERQARTVLGALGDSWSEVLPTEGVRQRAERLLRVHPLRAADALQLAAALVWAEDSPRDRELVCLDANLAEAAHKEGFLVLP